MSTSNAEEGGENIETNPLKIMGDVIDKVSDKMIDIAMTVINV